MCSLRQFTLIFFACQLAIYQTHGYGEYATVLFFYKNLTTLCFPFFFYINYYTTLVPLIIFFCFLRTSAAIHHESGERRMHPVFNFKAAVPTQHNISKRSMPMINFGAPKTEEEYSHYWNTVGQNILEKQIAEKSQLNTNLARNIIFFLGDGMSIPTLTAGRVYLGGEEKQYSFERFPYVGLSKVSVEAVTQNREFFRNTLP